MGHCPDMRRQFTLRVRNGFTVEKLRGEHKLIEGGGYVWQDMHFIAIYIDLHATGAGTRVVPAGMHAWAVLVCCWPGHRANGPQSAF